MIKIKYILITILIFHITSCDNKNSNFDWLIGTWECTNCEPDTKTIETWEKVDFDMYQGISVLLNKNDTIYTEKATIIKEGDHFFYITDLAQNPKPARFKIVKFNNQSFNAENTKHNYPLTISYKRNNDVIKAKISGSGRQDIYNFKKLSP